MTYSKAFSQWWSSTRDSATDAQKQVLSFLPFYPESDGKRVATVNLVELSGRNRAINEVEILRKDEPVERNLVILHGYGAGLGLFYRYFHLLCHEPLAHRSRVLGFGRLADFKLMVGILMD